MITFRKKATAIVLTAMMTAAVFSGCGSDPAPDTGSKADPASSGSQSAQSYGAGEFKKYDPKIEASFGYPHDVNADGIVAMEKNGEPLDNNRWIKYFRDDVGVECSYKLMAPNTTDYDQKLLMAMASGDLPDIFWVTDLSLLKQLVDAGAVADLTDVYAQGANPTLKNVMESEGENIFNPVTFEGRRYAIPVKMPSTNGYNHCWVRQDWLDELNLERPKTMDDVMAIAKAFKENDMGGKGNIGMMLNKDYIAEMKGIFWAFGGQTAVRKYWSTMDDGTVAFSEVQPEMKGGLGWLAEMYSQNLVNQEFATQDIAKAFEYVANNQCGIFYGPHWYGFRLFSADSSLDPTANWVAVGLPTGTDEPTQVYATNCFDAVTCVNAEYENPDAVVQLLNAYSEKLFGENNDFDNYFSCEQNDGVWGASPLHVLDPLVDLTPHRDMKKAVEDGTTDQLTGAAKSYWKYINTDGQKSYNYMFGVKDSCFNFVDDTYPDIVQWNAYFGAPTQTWADRWSSLQELIDTTYLQIIQGKLPLEEGFDGMCKQWHDLGGQQVTDEVNEVVASYEK